MSEFRKTADWWTGRLEVTIQHLLDNPGSEMHRQLAAETLAEFRQWCEEGHGV